MVWPAQGLLRWLRVSWLGVVGFVLSLAAHVAAGSTVPGPVVLALLAGLTALVAVLLTGVRLSTLRIAVSLTAGQMVPHEVFMWLGAAGACVRRRGVCAASVETVIVGRREPARTSRSGGCSSPEPAPAHPDSAQRALTRR
jgi:hypothetical protein